MSIYDEIKQERRNQNIKWGEQNHYPTYWMVILMEEVGEAAQCLCGKSINYKNYRKEMIQVAAVAIAALECFDKNDI